MESPSSLAIRQHSLVGHIFGLSDAECVSQMFHSLSYKQIMRFLHPLCHSSSSQPHLHTKKLLACVLLNVPVCWLNSTELELMFCEFVSFLEVQEEWFQDHSTSSIEMGLHELNLEWMQQWGWEK